MKLPTAVEISQTRGGYISCVPHEPLRAVIYLSQSLPHIQGRALLSDGYKKAHTTDTVCTGPVKYKNRKYTENH
jgi:hypothetical protein